MNKKTKFLIVVAIIIIAVLAASKFVPGFDTAVQDTVLAPAWAAIVSLANSVITHPLWLQYGFAFCFIGGIALTAITALYLWPKLKPQAKKVTVPLQDKIATTATKIPVVKQAVSLPTPAPTPAATPSEPATEEPAE